jgi:transposase InsO family protein
LHCCVLGVSRSGYCGFRQRAKIAPKACLVSTLLKAEFAASGCVYGSCRLGAAMRAQGLQIGRHRVRRMMRESKLRAVWRRKFVHTTDSAHSLPVSDNLLARRFKDALQNPRQAGWTRIGMRRKASFAVNSRSY